MDSHRVGQWNTIASESRWEQQNRHCSCSEAWMLSKPNDSLRKERKKYSSAMLQNTAGQRTVSSAQGKKSLCQKANQLSISTLTAQLTVFSILRHFQGRKQPVDLHFGMSSFLQTTNQQFPDQPSVWTTWSITVNYDEYKWQKVLVIRGPKEQAEKSRKSKYH